MRLKGRISGRVLAFVTLATLLATANTYGSTLAAALFLNRAGAEAIPLYYVLYAALSIPVSVAFSQIIDRWPRTGVFTVLLIGGALATAAAAPAARSESTALFYILYIVISVFEQLSYSVFYVLLADYFTSVETNRSTTALAIGMALGGLIGGALAGIGAGMFPSADLLFGMPALLAVTLGFFLVMRRRVAALGEAEPQGEETLRESLAAFRPIIARYPIVALLALGVFLNIVVQSLIEYQVFVVYADRFPKEGALTSFLGALNGILNLVNIVTNAVFTGPLLTRIGVARMNLVYPAMTVSAFAAFGVSFSLPAAIFGHVVYDPWAHSVDAPVFVSNYNAVPHRFVGRTRIINDGLMYPLAMAVTGAALWLVQDLISQRVVTLSGLACALAFLASGIAIRRAYAQGLVEMLRSSSVDLSAGQGAAVEIADAEVRCLLRSDDPKEQSLGLELAARGDATVFQAEIENLLRHVDGPARSLFVRRFSGKLNDALRATALKLLGSENAAVRATAIEALVGSAYVFPEAMLQTLVADPSDEVAGVAAIEASRRKLDSPAIRQALTAILGGPEPMRFRALRVIRQCGDPALNSLLARLREGGSKTVLTRVLEAAAVLGAVPGTEVWARAALADSGPDSGPLRSAAYGLLAVRRDTTDLPLLERGLGDPLKEVRLASAAALATFGEAAVPAIRRGLAAGDHVREEAAIDAAGRIGGSVIDALLYDHLATHHFTAIRRNVKWLDMLPPAGDLRSALLAPLAAALVDANRRALEAALAVVSSLGYRRTLQAMRGILAGGDARSRANAVETIASIGHRRFVQPLLPILEGGLEAAAVRRGSGTPPELQQILAAAAKDPSPWLRAAAVLAAPPGAAVSSVGRDADPIVDDALAYMRDPARADDAIMTRLVFLAGVPLFGGLFLEDLASVDRALGRQNYAAGATIMRQGDKGSTLFIIAEGTAVVRLGDGEGHEVARLEQGEFFGEMSLFDDKPRSATVVAVTDSTLLTLERDRFTTLIRQRPDVLLCICRMFGRRLREANRRLLAA